MPDGAKTGSGARWSEFDLEVVLYRRVLLVLEATRCREAADTHLAVRRVDPQEVLEERRLVPVEELGEEVMERSPSTPRQREDPLGDPAGASADVCPLVPFPRGGDPETLRHVGRRLVGRYLEPPLPEAELAVVQVAVEREGVAAARVAADVLLVDAGQPDVRYRVRGAHVRAPAPRDDVFDLASVLERNPVALVVVDVSSDGGDVVVLGCPHDLVDRAAAFDHPRMVLAVDVDRLAREQDLRLVASARDPPQPLALFAVYAAAHARVDAHDQQRPSLDSEVGCALVRPLSRSRPPGPLARRYRRVHAVRPSPQPSPHALLQGRGALRTGRLRPFRSAQMEHEAAETVVPVVIARQGVDGGRVVAVRAVELVFVLFAVSGGVHDVAADQHEVRVSSAREQRRHDRELRGVPLPGVADHEERDLLEPRVFPDDQIFREPPGLALDLHPPASLVVGRVSEEVSEDLVPGPPQGRGVEPGERPQTGGGNEAPEIAGFPANPAGPRQRIPRRLRRPVRHTIRSLIGLHGSPRPAAPDAPTGSPAGARRAC